MAAECTPEGADNDFVLIEGVVDVAGDLAEVNTTKTGNAGLRIRSTRLAEAPGRGAPPQTR